MTTETTGARQTDVAGAPDPATGDHAAQPAPGETAPVWQHRHVLDLDDFTTDEIITVLDLADRMQEVLQRRIARVPVLRGHTVVNLFYEPSTRTRASFELAGKVLGADVISLSVAASSVQKGESLIDTVRTLRAMGADSIIIRHSSSGAPYLAARHTNASILNAGDGAHAHPTQALLDLYTMRSHFGDLTGKRVAMIGDISHSRVARSDLWGLTALGADVVVCGPPTLLPIGLDASQRRHACGLQAGGCSRFLGLAARREFRARWCARRGTRTRCSRGRPAQPAPPLAPSGRRRSPRRSRCEL